jgi:mannan endo-1,4-beta-mannosidase
MRISPTLILTFVECFISRLSTAQIDANASATTVTLYDNLKIIQNSSWFLFGQEFFNSFRYSSGSAHGDEEYSDSKAVTGSHPAVLGSDFHYYLEKSAEERNNHTEAVRWAYQQGYVITFDWHLSARGTTSYEYSDMSKDLVNNIVNDLNGDRSWFFEQLDLVIDIINNDLVVETDQIPIVFRPLHEMNGGWFWWGSQATTAAYYIELYRMLVTYVRDRTNSVLFCWSPNTPVNFDYYPGDDYVDVLGVDSYEIDPLTIRGQLVQIVDHAQANGKVAVFSETGYRLNPGTTSGDDARSAYWKDVVLPAILDDPAQKAQRIAWMLTWINASWSFPYVPHGNSSNAAKTNFIDFKKSPFVVFGDEVPDIYAPNTIVGLPDADNDGTDVLIYPLPAQQHITLTVSGFESNVYTEFYDLHGRLLHQLQMEANTIDITLKPALSAGLYLLKVSDRKRSVTKKIVVQ